MKHILHIPNYTPPSVNELLSKHWGSRGKIKQGHYDIVLGHALEQGISPATGKRRVSLILIFEKGQRMGDESNLWKILEDALVSAKLLVNDSPKWLTRGTVKVARGETRETFVILEDVCPNG